MSRTGCLVLAVIVIFVYSFRELLGGVGSVIFVFGDKLLGPSSLSPVILWSVFGLFMGACAGSFVAYRKFRLAPVVMAVPLAALLLFCFSASLLKDGHRALPAGEEFDLSDKDKIIKSAGIGLWASVSASSQLADAGEESFSADNLLDHKRTTSWIENAGGSGINETITFHFLEKAMKKVSEMQCVGLRIRNGAQKSSGVWKKNNRLKDFSISHSGGRVIYLQAKDLKDEAEEIRFESPVIIKPGDRLIVSIISVYHGTSTANMTAISELAPIVDVVMK